MFSENNYIVAIAILAVILCICSFIAGYITCKLGERKIVKTHNTVNAIKETLNEKDIKDYSVLFGLRATYHTVVQANSKKTARKIAEKEFANTNFGKADNIDGKIVNLEIEL